MYNFESMALTILAAGRAQQQGNEEEAKRLLEEARIFFDGTVEAIVEERENRRRWSSE
jgi:hypothetical protein